MALLKSSLRVLNSRNSVRRLTVIYAQPQSQREPYSYVISGFIYSFLFSSSDVFLDAVTEFHFRAGEGKQKAIRVLKSSRIDRKSLANNWAFNALLIPCFFSPCIIRSNWIFECIESKLFQWPKWFRKWIESHRLGVESEFVILMNIWTFSIDKTFNKKRRRKLD